MLILFCLNTHLEKFGECGFGRGRFDSLFGVFPVIDEGRVSLNHGGFGELNDKKQTPL